jgi:hypothetical protein
MVTTPEALKERDQDYFIAHWKDNQLEMEPHCRCGQVLDEDYHCEVCDRDCECTFVLCSGEQTYEVVNKFLHGSPDFKHFQADLMG